MLYLHGVGHCHPENVIDNAFLESLNIDTNDQWIRDRVGILERRTGMSLDYIRSTHNNDPREAPNNLSDFSQDMVKKAFAMALERAQISQDQIGMVWAGSCYAEHSIPANACVYAASLGLNVPAFDINSACSTFVVQLHMLSQMEAMPDYVLMIIPEAWTRMIDYSDRRTAVLAGDAHVCAIVSRKHASQFRLSNVFIISDPSGWDKGVGRPGCHFSQEGSAIQKFAIRKTFSIIDTLREKTKAENPYFIGHQANLTMLQSVCKRAEIADDRHLYNVDRFGNCGAAGAPSVLSQNFDRFKANDTILLGVVGVGLTWGGVCIEVEDAS